MTTILRLNALRKWMAGKLDPELIERKNKHAALINYINNDWGQGPFNGFKTLLAPLLEQEGYGYFLACDSQTYMEQQAFANENGLDSIGYCDVFQLPRLYPRAFRHKEEAALFKLHWDCEVIELDDKDKE